MKPLFEAIKTATIAGIIRWEPTEEVVYQGTEYEMRGYMGKYKNFTLTTRVGPKKTCGLSIATETRVFTLSSNPRVLSGKKTDGNELFLLALIIQSESEKRDLDGLLHRTLTQAFLGCPCPY